MQFGKDELHHINEVALHVTLCETLEFVNISQYVKLVRVHPILEETFFETHMVDVRCKPARL